MFTKIALVALGSAVGGVGRFLVSLLPLARSGLPFATLAVNTIGSLLIGALGGYLSRGSVHGESIRVFAVVGFCGGFTTFSTFSNEMFKMLESGRFALSAMYVSLSVLGGLIAVWIGYGVSR